MNSRSDDPALRALDIVTKAFDEYLWGLSISPGGGPCEDSVTFFRDGLLGRLAAAEAASLDVIVPDEDIAHDVPIREQYYLAHRMRDILDREPDPDSFAARVLEEIGMMDRETPTEPTYVIPFTAEEVADVRNELFPDGCMVGAWGPGWHHPSTGHHRAPEGTGEDCDPFHCQRWIRPYVEGVGSL